MDMKNKDKYENYDDDVFYEELKRQIVELIDNSEEVKQPSKFVSSVSKNCCKDIISGNYSRIVHRNYYDWSVCERSIGQGVSKYYQAAKYLNGTGVFIPHAVKFESQESKI
ncbi:hypothetical protein BUALT_Bualt17G0094500 [Buddleja alternifolia]|uniref:Uncharacterized protein n=1 Tax=Buddleja alternifolia TaxID=168488 RepID=A0AAV6WI33_9LAMI|nr:hypothetical protein BUALT_Bualt17G0094500 [Buddleja alternifolia]